MLLTFFSVDNVYAEDINPYFEILKIEEIKEGILTTALIKDYKTGEISRMEEFDLNSGDYSARVYDMEGTLLNEVTRVNGKVTLKEKGEIVENEAIVERIAITPFAWEYMSWNYRYFKQSDVDLADRIVITLLAATLGAAAGLAAQILLDIRYHNAKEVWFTDKHRYNIDKVNEKSAREGYIYTYANSSRTKLIGTRYYSKNIRWD